MNQILMLNRSLMHFGMCALTLRICCYFCCIKQNILTLNSICFFILLFFSWVLLHRTWVLCGKKNHNFFFPRTRLIFFLSFRTTNKGINQSLSAEFMRITKQQHKLCDKSRAYHRFTPSVLPFTIKALEIFTRCNYLSEELSFSQSISWNSIK